MYTYIQTFSSNYLWNWLSFLNCNPFPQQHLYEHSKVNLKHKTVASFSLSLHYKIPTERFVLVQIRHLHHRHSITVTCSRHDADGKITHLVLNDNHSLSRSVFYLYRLNFSTRLGMVLLNQMTNHAELSMILFACFVAFSLSYLIYSNIAPS